jgi:hypothetical protein
MGLFARRSSRPPRPSRVPLGRPQLDGGGWPDEAVVGRPSFEANTYYELANRNAYDGEAHALAEELVDAAMPHVPTGTTAEDQPYVRKLFTVAARIGFGIGIVERSLDAPEGDTVDRHIAGALWQARRKQPAMPPQLSGAAAWFLLAGYWVARTEPTVIPVLVDDLSRGSR